MNTVGTKTIETERLVLRRYKVEDAGDMYQNWTSDPEVTKFLSWPTHTSVEFTKKLLTQWVSYYDEGRTYNWGITVKGDDRVIGNIAVVERDERTCSYEIGYCLCKAYWGQGIMPEALRAVIDYLFEGESDLMRIYATHDLRNPKSGRVMEKAGMHFDGILRGSKKNNLGLHDTAYYSVLRNDVVMREQYEKLFLSIHPGFFERDYVKRVPEDESASEMFLRLQEFDPECYQKDLPENVTFGYYNGDFEELLAAVGEVIPHWVPLFSKESRVYCGFVDGKIASFCMIENFGEHVVDGMTWKIGGPGCVGTVPAYRDRGIGLSMVRNVTQILREELYDYSYIHYTYETKWYGKLGYRTVLSWNGKGFVS
ncbi:MAG: GNAT family N-acetyltransferase [Lachnospiraceae bacterium]|nr:GNAT family N-acetyltransferase [Lachnospiraceae bacterium]